ncbi:MAG TPA: tetratricopeptide repeat protein, partial [Blastocatellia bacterium]|nr:tetratricopeptide repeat protein [Blastocatellia bacterium]
MMTNNTLMCVVICLLISSVGLAQGKKPLNKKGVLEVTEVVASAPSKYRSKAMTEAVQTINEFGVDFQITPDIEAELRTAGGDENLITAVRTNYRARKAEPAPASKSIAPPDPAKVAGMALAVEAYNLQYRGFYSNAVAQARKAVAEDPKNAYAHAVLGYALAETSQYIEAEKEAREALRLNEKSAIAYLTLGGIHFHQNRYDDAEQEMKYAIALDPNLSDAYNDIGVLYLVRNRVDEAEQSYVRAVSVAADNPVTRTNLS